MNTGGTLASKAVERALDERHREASEEVERILAAAVRVMQGAGSNTPRVSDIVAEAGSSKKAFYRYFAGKDDLMLAVLERGVGIIVSYLEHQMAKEDRPEDKIARWITGALAQVADPHLLSMSRAVAGQISLLSDTGHDDVMGPMRDLLIGPVTALGGDDRRALDEAADVDHLVRFCLRGLGR